MSAKKYKVKIGDKVVITTGESKNQQGKILKIDRNKDRVLVGGVNIISKHEKPSASNPQGGIVKKEAFIHISNVSLLDPKSGKPTRVGYEIKNDKKVRVSRKSKEVI